LTAPFRQDEGIVYEGKNHLDSVSSQNREAITREAPPSILTTRTKIKVNIAFSHRLQEIAPRVDGVGLLRIEHMIAQSQETVEVKGSAIPVIF
jgi:phosphoenolpyruvate synthase/pyruvate phosphate dikinase